MKMNAKKWAVLAAVVALVVVGAIAAVYLSGSRGGSVYASVKIEAVKTGPHGVEPDTAFSVTLDRSVNEEALRAMLRTEPELDYTLSGGGKRWTLTPVLPLAENAVYTFRVVDETGAVVRSYAFQTKSGLLVNTAYPRPGATWVELESGIEFTFNTTDVDVTNSLEIEPKTAGKLRITGNTAVFVPDAPLLADSIYRVTLKAGLTAPNGMALAEDYTFQFETVTNEDSKTNYDDLALLGGFDETFLPGDPVVLRMRGGDMSGAQMTFTVHRYADTQEYAGELQKRAAFYSGRTGIKQEYEVKTETLEPVTEIKSELTPGDIWWSSSWIALQEGLPQGCYVLTLRGESPAGRPQFVQKLVQVSNVAAYTQAADGDALVWLVDAAAGEPMVGTRVQLQEIDGAEQRAGVTDDGGALLLSTDEMESAWVSVTDGGQLVYFGSMELDTAHEKRLWENYYIAVYKDRELYQPTDKIRFWGVLRPRGGAKLPQFVTAELGTGGEEASLYQTRLTIGADGTFGGELSFTGLEQGWYSLVLSDGGEGVYWSGSAQIQKFTKPPIVITAQADKAWYYEGDTVNMTFTAAYYDGTPAAGAALRFTCAELTGQGKAEAEGAVDEETAKQIISAGGSVDDETRQGVVVTLDEQGHGSYTAKVEGDWSMWNPMRVYYQVQSADTQEVYLETSGFLRVVPSRYACELTNPEKGSLTIKTALLNAQAMDRDAAELYSPEDWSKSEFERLAGAAVELPVKVEFMETVSRRVPDGEYYDEINNKTVTRYRYEAEEHVLRTEEVRTMGGQVTLTYAPEWTYTSDTEYWARITYDGGLGSTVEEYSFFGRRGEVTYEVKHYAFAPAGAKDSFSLNEAVPLALYENGKQIPNNGRMLYSRIRDGIDFAITTAESSEEVIFGEESMPNAAIAGAYFDGKHIYEISPYELRYNYGERTLKVEVQPEQASYAPGAEAKLSITLRDAEGKPVAGTACVGVVDESIFTLKPQEVAFVNQLYGNLSSTNVVQKSSYTEYNLRANPDTAGGMGGGGAEGGAELRSDFADTALFQTVTVDASGTAELRFTLPDNVTKWRVTAAAVTADGKAGDGKSSTVATLPFYVRMVATDTYLTEDDLTVGALAVGTELKAGTEIEYTAELLDGGKNKLAEKKVRAQAGVQAYASFGKQPEGQYTLRLTAAGGDFSDAVEQPVTVAKTAATARVTQRMELSELAGVKPERWPVVVRMYDTRLEQYMETLRVLSGRSGERTEILAAAYRAQVAQNELLPEEERREIQKDGRLFALQDYESGVKPLQNAEPDAAVTAKMLLATPQLVNSEFARVYLQKVLGDASATQDSRLMAYVGLAALHEPVMLDIMRLLEDEALTTAQRLYLGAGLAALGDFEGAQAVYSTVAVEKGKTEGTRRWVDGSDENEREQNTAAALLLCSITGHADAEGLAAEFCARIQEKPREDAKVVYDLELFAYARYFRFNVGEQATFSYTAGGKRETVELGLRGFKSLTLSAEAFAAADFKAERGNAAAEIEYSGAAALPEATTGEALVTVEKLITPLGGSLAAPSLARVDLWIHFAPDAPEGVYKVFDAIPSGMRYMPYTGNGMMTRGEGSWWSEMSNEGQQMQGNVWLSRQEEIPVPLTLTEGAQEATEPAVGAENENPNTNPGADTMEQNPCPYETETTGKYTLTYYVSCALPGSYVLEHTYLTDAAGVIIAASPRSTVTVD